jgi:hypothetical protein
VGVRCGSWRCEVCSVSNRRAFVKRLEMGLRTPSRELPKVLTLTAAPGEPAYRSRALLGRRFAELRRRLERAFPGVHVEYAGSVEMTQAGAVHFHVVLRGVPFMPVGKGSPWSRLASGSGFGRIAFVEAANVGLGRYLSKSLGGYLTKQAGSNAWPPHFRRIRFSRPRGPRHPGADADVWVLYRVVHGPAGVVAANAALTGYSVAGQGPPHEVGGAAAIP